MYEYKMPLRPQNSNKGTFGKVINVSGSENYIGASYLSTLSILKSGAGYTALCTCDKVINSVSKILPEAVYISRKQGLKTIANYSAMLIGCGLGLNLQAKNDFKNFIKSALKYNLPTIIDADGLNILSKLKSIELPKQTIITPHPMEAARLLGINLEEVTNNLEESAKLLSKKFNCTAVLKTHRTIICQGENIFTNQYGNSALAKAGTGDVLAGIIAGLTVQGMNPFEASKTSVYLHSRAGEIASEDLTEYSVLASDVIKYLPYAIKEVL